MATRRLGLFVIGCTARLSLKCNAAALNLCIATNGLVSVAASADTRPPTAENIAEGRFSMSLTWRIHIRSKARPIARASFNHVDWGVGSIAATRGVNFLGFGIVLDVALGPCSTMPILWPHALRFRLHRSIAAVKVVDIQGKRTGLRHLQHRKTQGHGICHHVRPKLIKALAADQLETHRQNHQLSQARSSHGHCCRLLGTSGNESWS